MESPSSEEWIDLEVEEDEDGKQRKRRRRRKSRRSSSQQDEPAIHWFPSATYKEEVIQPIIPSAKERWIRFLKSDFVDLFLVGLMWAAAGVLIYVLDINVPTAYREATWVAVALFAFPMSIYTAMHVYELYVTRKATKKAMKKVLLG
ncbi:hypothetical protein AC1031_016746 [Aphanomyces cochlioides]|nr:hypothetical protein AC1031_016746 [Aphanomyces cochlioides]